MTAGRSERTRLASPCLTVDVHPEQGGRIASIRHLPSGAELLLQTPWADDDWTGSAAMPDTGDEWHRRYPGGWHGLLPHAGTARTVDGITQPFHGEAAWRAWRIVEQDAQSAVTLGLTLRTVPVEVRREIAVSGDTVTVRQTLVNLVSRPVELTWTEHPAFGPDILAPDTVVTLGPDTDPVLRSSTAEPGPAFRTVSVPTGSARLVTPSRSIAIELAWDPQIFPYAHVWHELGSLQGFPWWGQVRTMAVEPATRVDTFSPGDPLGPLVVASGASVTAVTTLRAKSLTID